MEELRIVALRVESKEVRGGKASTTNLKKLGVVTAHWMHRKVEHNLKSD